MFEPIDSIKKVKTSSDRAFGFTFTIVFFLVAFAFLKRNSQAQYLAIIFSILTFLVSIMKPSFLSPLNKVWAKLGLLLNKITSPIILGIIFFVIISPVALLFKLARKNTMSAKFKKNEEIKSYWLLREPPGPERNSLENQF